MVAYMKRFKALKKKVECLCATKSSKKKHPIFARIEDNAYWFRQCQRADDALVELEKLFDDIPIVEFKTMTLVDDMRRMEEELTGFPMRPPRVMTFVELRDCGFVDVSHTQQQPRIWRPNPAVIDFGERSFNNPAFPANPFCITQQEIDHGLPDEFFLEHGKEVHFVDEFSPAQSQADF